MALTDLTRISTSGIATGTSLSGAILHGDTHFRGSQVGVTSALFDSSEDELKFNDNVKLKFGDGGDLNLYHTGSHSYIQDNGSGNLILDTKNGFSIRLTYNDSDNMLRAVRNEAVELYWNNSKKFETTNHGAVVTGILTATGFSGPTNNTSGISTFYDLRVSNNLTVEGTITTLDTNLIGVDRVEVGANSNTVTGIAVTQSGTADIVRLYDGASQVVTVDDVGNVGIGSVIPSAKLDVTAGAINNAIFVKTTSDKSQIKFEHNGGPNYNTRIGSTTLAAGNVGLLFETGTAAARLQAMVIDRYGKVGIGTQTPNAKFVVSNAGANGFEFNPNFNGNNSIIASYNRVSDAYTQFTLSASQIIFSQGGTEYGRFDTNGRLGIGTDNPVEKLHVVTTSSDPTPLLLERTHNNNVLAEFKNSTASMYVGLAGDALGWSVGIGENLGLQSNNKFMVRRDTGNIGIGTDNPDQELHVMGQIKVDAGAYGRVEYARDGTNLWSAGLRTSDDFFFFRESGSGNVIFQHGKVGIGTDSPRAAYLHVGDSSSGGTVLSSSPLSVFASGNLGGTTGNDHKIAIFAGKSTGNTSGLSLYHYRRSTGTDWTTDGFSFRQEVDDTSNIYNYMSFAGGNVGIGIENPKTDLDISNSAGGTLTLSCSDDSSSADQLIGKINFHTADPSGDGPQNNAIISAHSVESTGSGAYLKFSTATGATGSEGADAVERLRIDSNGNLTLTGTTGNSSPRFTLKHSNADVEGEVIRIARTDLDTIRYHSIKAKHSGNSLSNYISVNVHDGGGSPYTSQTEVARFLGAGGMTFNGDTATANALDDYETGTFTPVIYGHTTGTGSNTVSGAGTYVKVGNKCTICLAFINKNGTGLPSSEQMRISGIPFAFKNGPGNQTSAVPFIYNIDFNTSHMYTFIGGNNLSYLRGYLSRAASTWTPWLTSSWSVSQFYFYVNMTYITA